ncbi:MAG: trigger factor [Candidatus Omnitrophica bacterium]|nr:trigger factor [Candidatus Omnitrophota bacterium]
MKTEVKKIDATKLTMRVEVNGDIVKDKFEEVFKKIGQEAKVPGFRPGHAPRDIVEKNFSHLAHEQVLKELIPQVYQQAIDKEKLDVIELPTFQDVKLDRANLSFSAQFEVKPQILLKNYKGLKVAYKKISVSGEEIKRYLDSIKEAKKAPAIDDHFAKSLSYADVGELEQAVERQLYIQKENQQRQWIEQQIIDGVTKGLEFKLPESLVKKQLEDLVKQAKVELALKGVPREKIAQEEANLVKELEPQARVQVKVYLVLAEIARQENIALDDQMPSNAIGLLLREADWKESA